MSRDLVSIIIPVYNGANYVRDAINSALAQTYPHFEVIVVDDGSTDNTKEICRGYGNRIRYFQKENGGVSSALNLGVTEMRGEYFTWLAHDDMFYPNKLKVQIEALAQCKDKTAIVHGNYDLLNVTRGTTSHMRQEDSYSIEQLTNSVFPLLMATLHASTPLFHKSHFARIGMFDENLPLSQDYDLLFRMMRGRRSVFVSEPLLVSRLHNQSGKNTDNRFGLACSQQYNHFANTLTYDEVRNMFTSPGAFYCRMAAMMKARADTDDSDKVLSICFELPDEDSSTNKLVDFIKSISGGKSLKNCIFGAGYHGRVLKFELMHRGINVVFFCDNNMYKHDKIIDGIFCKSLAEIEKDKDNILIIAAADISDEMECQLADLGFPHVTTKKRLDALILESAPIIQMER